MANWLSSDTCHNSKNASSEANVLRPPSKNRPFRKKHQKWVFIIERCSKLSSFRIYRIFWKKSQIWSNFQSKHRAYPSPPFFSKKSDVLSYESLLSKNFNLILLHWELPFILDYLDYFLLVSVVLSQLSSYLDMLFLTKKVKAIGLTWNEKNSPRKLAIFGAHLMTQASIKKRRLATCLVQSVRNSHSV